MERGVVAIEVVSRTRLGKISGTALFRAPDGLDGVDYWTLTLEAYAVSQATRPDGPRDVARFNGQGQGGLGRAREIAEALGIKDKFEAFYRSCTT